MNNLKNKIPIILFIIQVMFWSGCATTADGVDSVSFSDAVEKSAERIAKELPTGSRIAIVAWDSPSNDISEYIIEELTGAFVDRGMVVVDRQNLEYIAKEQNFQLSGAVSDDSARSIGKFLGADVVITGQLIEIGGPYRYRASAINVENATRDSVTRFNVRGDAETRRIIIALSDKSTINQPENKEVVYKIGDFGPAGGIIFYDKGVFSNGWRYMEAAPSETEFTSKFPWDRQFGYYLEGTRDEVGFGKRNTQIMVEYLNQIGESEHIAQLCMDLEIDGFNDWFLPSKDELDLMYNNLKLKGLGGFIDTFYWSSSKVQYIKIGRNEYGNDVSYQNFKDGRKGYGLLGGDVITYEHARAVRCF